jgi:hypothetical protein
MEPPPGDPFDVACGVSGFYAVRGAWRCQRFEYIINKIINQQRRKE